MARSVDRQTVVLLEVFIVCYLNFEFFLRYVLLYLFIRFSIILPSPSKSMLPYHVRLSFCYSYCPYPIFPLPIYCIVHCMPKVVYGCSFVLSFETMSFCFYVIPLNGHEGHSTACRISTLLSISLILHILHILLFAFLHSIGSYGEELITSNSRFRNKKCFMFDKFFGQFTWHHFVSSLLIIQMWLRQHQDLSVKPQENSSWFSIFR